MDKKLQAIIVDDDPVISRYLNTLLLRKNFTSIVAADADEAISWIKQNDMPELIFIDIFMPKMNGWAFWNNLLFIRDYEYVHIVMMSNDHDMKARAMQAGIDDFLIKPFSILEVENIIDKVVKKWTF